jgi:hypothetical protein
MECEAEKRKKLPKKFVNLMLIASFLIKKFLLRSNETGKNLRELLLLIAKK